MNREPAITDPSGRPGGPAEPFTVTHSIRLRGAWETTRDAGRTAHRRNFGRPRTLAPGERLWLVCAHVPGPGEVLLNGAALAAVSAEGPFAADVTERLLSRNVVAFVIASGEALGEVAVEVRTAT